ncbi:MAG: AAA family ATPase [Gracilibacteraceae bacterium]|jgi:CO dehydrogenase maturation factor|nr:AAA family ATPase [Gracilibacteraceae bacterium]
MKIAIMGKGGVGKTTLAAILARLYAAEGRPVLAVDADPDANLGLALGFAAAALRKLTPVAAMNELIAERTGAAPGSFGLLFKINPLVADIPDRFSLTQNGVKLLVMGTVATGGAGCVCPEHVVLRRLLQNLVMEREEVVIMDMEAGLEHLGRGTAAMVDRFVTVIEPGARSVQTYEKIRRLAADLGVREVSAVANKVRGPADEEFIRARIPAAALLGVIHYDDNVIRADKEGISPFELSPAVTGEIRGIKEAVGQPRRNEEAEG